MQSLGDTGPHEIDVVIEQGKTPFHKLKAKRRTFKAYSFSGGVASIVWKNDERWEFRYDGRGKPLSSAPPPACFSFPRPPNVITIVLTNAKAPRKEIRVFYTDTFEALPGLWGDFLFTNLGAIFAKRKFPYIY